MMSFRHLLPATAALLCLAPALMAQPLSKADVEKIVKEYIAKNGNDLVTSIEKAQDARQMAKFKAVINANTPVMGPANAKVTVVEFSDFQCPFCDKVQASITPLRAKYGDKVRWAFKQMPLDFHPQAKPAALAALAAHRQGKFWPYTKLLWANQAKLGDAYFKTAATELKLDLKKFDADRASPDLKAIVEADMKDASEIGVQGTPYFVINGKGVSGALPAEAFEKIIDAELKK